MELTRRRLLKGLLALPVAAAGAALAVKAVASYPKITKTIDSSWIGEANETWWDKITRAKDILKRNKQRYIIVGESGSVGSTFVKFARPYQLKKNAFQRNLLEHIRENSLLVEMSGKEGENWTPVKAYKVGDIIRHG